MLTALLTGLTAGFVVVLAAYIVYRRVKSQILAKFAAIFAAPDEKTPSQFALFVDAAAQVFTARLVLQLKTTVMGMSSVDSRKEMKLEEAEVMAGNPMLGVLLNLVPGLRRQLRNPLVAGAISKVLQNMGGTGGTKDNGHTAAPPPGPDRAQLFFPLK